MSSSPSSSGDLSVIFEFPKVSSVLQVPRPVSNTLKALKVLAKFPKFLVSVAHILEALRLSAALQVPRPVSDNLEAPQALAKFPSSSSLWLTPSRFCRRASRSSSSHL